MRIISLRRHTQFACVHNIGIKLYTDVNHKLGWWSSTYSIHCHVGLLLHSFLAFVLYFYLYISFLTFVVVLLYLNL